jgi:hypothetical protein
MKTGKPVHPATNGSGTAPDAATTPTGVEVSFDGGANRLRQGTMQIHVTNREAANGLEISFNEGKDWFVVPAATLVTFNVLIHRVRLRGVSGATSDYSILGVV